MSIPIIEWNIINAEQFDGFNPSAISWDSMDLWYFPIVNDIYISIIGILHRFHTISITISAFDILITKGLIQTYKII